MFRILASILWIIVFGFLYITPAQAYCLIPGGSAVSQNIFCEPAGLSEFEDIFANVVKVSVGLAFIILVILLVTAGIKFLTSGGEGKAVQSASNTVTWAILGILFLAIAWLVLMLLQTITGIKLTVFDLKALCDPTVTTFFCL